MRKADYSNIVFAIREELAKARQVADDEKSSEHDRTVAKGAIAALKNVAQSFAYVASVDRAAFLKACGID